MPTRVKRLLAALWSACKSIDLEDCLKDIVYVAGCASLWYGGWLIAPACGYLVLGVVIVVPRMLRGPDVDSAAYKRGAPKPEPRNVRSWAS